MKFFVVIIHYKIPVEQFESIVPQHRAYLQEGYEKGYLLMSGPQNPRTGGIVIARANEMQIMQDFFLHDPYHLQDVAERQVIEFNPVSRQSFMEDWIAGGPV